jgi:hypothetical protein
MSIRNVIINKKNMFNWNIESNNHFLEIKNKHPEWTCQQIASNFLCTYLCLILNIITSYKTP